MENFELTREQIIAERRTNAKKFLIEYFKDKDIDPAEAENIPLINIENLPPQYKEQIDLLGDPRLSSTLVAVVPEKIWTKSEQPSESNAENDLVLFRADYLADKDNAAWMTHELAHCLRFKDAPEQYQIDSQTPAFDDVKSKYLYPNNKVEEYAFRRQFEFLKQKGLSREQIIEKLKADYQEPTEFKFFDKLLDQVYPE